MSLRQACRTLSLSRTVYFYQPDTRRDEPVIHALTELAERYPRYGFKKLFQLLRRQGNTWNHKRVHRIYCLLKLNFRRKGKQRLPVRNPSPLVTPEALNQSWSIDFMHDALVCGRRFRTFWIGPYISIHYLSLNPLLVRRRRYSRGERYPSALCGCHSL